MIQLPEVNNNYKVQTPEQEREQKLAEVAGLIARGLSRSDAAAVVGVDVEGARLPKQHTFLPTPDEIAKACLEFQAGWSATVRPARMAYPKCGAEFPTIAEREIFG